MILNSIKSSLLQRFLLGMQAARYDMNHSVTIRDHSYITLAYWSRLLKQPPAVWRELTTFFELCKNRFDLSGKGGIRASPGTHSYP